MKYSDFTINYIDYKVKTIENYESIRKKNNTTKQLFFRKLKKGFLYQILTNL